MEDKSGGTGAPGLTWGSPTHSKHSKHSITHIFNVWRLAAFLCLCYKRQNMSIFLLKCLTPRNIIEVKTQKFPSFKSKNKFRKQTPVSSHQLFFTSSEFQDLDQPVAKDSANVYKGIFWCKPQTLRCTFIEFSKVGTRQVHQWPCLAKSCIHEVC